MSDLWGVLLGAGIAAVAGFVGLVISKRTEHAQWLRNQKVEVYSALLRQAHLSSNSLDGYKQTGQNTSSLLEGVEDTTNARLLILAPYVVRHEAMLYRHVLEAAGRAENITSDKSFHEWKKRRGDQYNALEMAIRKDLNTHEKVRRSIRTRFWSVIYVFTDPFHRWYYEKYGVAWVTKHPTRAMRKHQRQQGG